MYKLIINDSYTISGIKNFTESLVTGDLDQLTNRIVQFFIPYEAESSVDVFKDIQKCASLKEFSFKLLDEKDEMKWSSNVYKKLNGATISSNNILADGTVDLILDFKE